MLGAIVWLSLGWIVSQPATPTAPADNPQACCFYDQDLCRFLGPEDCVTQGGTPQGPTMDCSWGVCCYGACCLPGGSCALLTYLECVVDHDGIWWGPNTTCDLTWCGDLEACCVPGGCIDAPLMVCLTDLDGEPQGLGSTCEAGPCPPQSQACCLPDGSCLDVDMTIPSEVSTCVRQEGMLMGIGTACWMSLCTPTEACCIRGPTEQYCMNFNPFVCEMSGGWALGPGSTCSTTIMCGTGVCCTPDASCKQRSEAGCVLEGGEFCGYGTICRPTTCQPEACCYGGDPCTGGFCDYVPPCRCLYQNAAPLGPAADCATWPCGEQACCMPDASCTDLATIDCLDEGGLAQGSGSNCATVACEPFRGGACCISETNCIITTSAQDCTDNFGGTFLGFDTSCPTQVVEHFSEPGQDGIFNHVVLKIVDCPEPGRLGERDCVPGPGPKLDLWTSPHHGAMCQIFGVSGSPAIPAGFFGSGSDAFTGPLCLRGVPLGIIALDEFGQIDLGDADTVILRDADPFDRCGLPADESVTVAIRVAALSLESIVPIAVTYNGGATSEQWAAKVDLSAVYTDGDPSNDPPLGALTATREHCNGGTYTNVLPVQPKFTFVKVGDPGAVAVLDAGLEGFDPVTLDISSSPAAWVTDVHLSLDAPNPICTDFHPGMEEEDPQTTCDCNSNLVRDKCDIEFGTSADCNTNAAPDECEDLSGGDFDHDGRTELDDYLALADCLAGPVAAPAPIDPRCTDTCLNAFDANSDTDVDLEDFAGFQTTFAK